MDNEKMTGTSMNGVAAEQEKLLELVVPSHKHEQAVMEYRQTFLDSQEPFDGCAGLEDCDSYSEWLQFERRNKAKYCDAYVPSSVFLAIRKSDSKLLGIIDIRHELTDFLLNYGGHIGYSVLPCERRKGYATQMLKSALAESRNLTLTRVLICCDKGNIASQKTIIANGGVFENEVEDIPHLGNSGIIQRYWIEL